MGRRSSGTGRASSRPAPRPAARPQKANNAPAPATSASTSSGGSFLGTLGSSIVEGFVFSAGWSFAQRAVDAVFGNRTIRVEKVDSQAVAAPSGAASMGGSDASCTLHSQAFQDCLNGYGTDISKCQFYMDMLTECKRKSGSVMSS